MNLNTILLLGLFLCLSTITIAIPINSKQQQSNQQTENVDQLIEETKEIATQAGTASNTIYTYIVRNEVKLCTCTDNAIILPITENGTSLRRGTQPGISLLHQREKRARIRTKSKYRCKKFF